MFPVQFEKINNKSSNSISYSDIALRLLVLVVGRLYWELPVTSSFSIWGCVLKGCFERGIFRRAKLCLKGIEDFNLEHCLRPLHTRDWEPVTVALHALSLVEKAELVQVCASHYALGTNGVSECKMDVKSTWVPTWHWLDHVSWSLFKRSHWWKKAEPVQVCASHCISGTNKVYRLDHVP